MTSVLLIYPFFRRRLDRSRFRFPPLGVAYVAAALQEAGHEVRVLDCTFLQPRRGRAAGAGGAGRRRRHLLHGDDGGRLPAGSREHLRGRCRLLVAGGPLPTCDPDAFLEHFDVVVRGEGEQTMRELLAAHEAGADLGAVPGVACRRAAGAAPAARLRARSPATSTRSPSPRASCSPTRATSRSAAKSYGYSITTVMSTRGCPFACEFCSNVVFGQSYRERSAQNVVDEIEEASRWATTASRSPTTCSP